MRRWFLPLLLAFPLAWNFGPVLLDILGDSGPIARALLTFLIPDNLTGQGFVFYFKFLFALVLFAVLLKAFGLLFSFALPQGQRFGTTKFLRRTQSLLAEAILLLFFFFLIPFVSLSLSEWPDTVILEAQASSMQKEPKPSWYERLFSKAKEGVIALVTGVQPAEKKPDKALIYWYTVKASWLAYLLGALALYLPVRFYLLTRRPIKRFIIALHGKVLGFFETGRFGLGGSARFAGFIEERALRYPAAENGQSGALFMGRSLYNRNLHIGLGGDQMMLTIGSSRSGKGATVIIPNLLLWEGSALVIDPKGTNAAVTAKRRQDMGQQVYIVDPFQVLNKEVFQALGKEERDGFNPLAEQELDLNGLTIREDIGVMADALVVPDTASKDTHWDDGARTVIGGLIAQLASKYNDPTLPMLRYLLAMGQEEQDVLWAAMESNRQAGDLARDAGSRIIRGMGTTEIQNIISNADKHSEWLSSRGIQNVLSKSTFRFSELKERPTTIYLVIPPRFLDIHRRFLRLFVNLALSEMSKGGRSKTQVLFVLDEFQQLGKMAEVEKAFRLLAGYNFIVWPFIQDWAGMVDLYGNSANTFLANSRAVQVFSLNDAQSLEMISKQVGARSMQYVRGMDSLSATPLRTPDEVSKETSIDSGQQYILRAGKAPLILEKVKYYEGANSRIAQRSNYVTKRRYPFFGLYDLDPDYS